MIDQRGIRIRHCRKQRRPHLYSPALQSGKMSLCPCNLYRLRLCRNSGLYSPSFQYFRPIRLSGIMIGMKQIYFSDGCYGISGNALCGRFLQACCQINSTFYRTDDPTVFLGQNPVKFDSISDIPFSCASWRYVRSFTYSSLNAHNLPIISGNRSHAHLLRTTHAQEACRKPNEKHHSSDSVWHRRVPLPVSKCCYSRITTNDNQPEKDPIDLHAPRRPYPCAKCRNDPYHLILFFSS